MRESNINKLNQDNTTVNSFGDEWSRMNQNSLNEEEAKQIFNDYFSIFPFDLLNKDSIGFDMGCGSGRWAAIVAPLVKKLLCIDASDKAIDVARNNLKLCKNISYKVSSVDKTGLREKSFDFGYSLGVLHHVPDTYSGIVSCSKLLKKGAPFCGRLFLFL